MKFSNGLRLTKKEDHYMNKTISIIVILCILILSLTSCKSNTMFKANSNDGHYIGTALLDSKSSEASKYSDKKHKWISTNETKDELKKLQDSVDNGHTPGYLNPQESAMDFIFQSLHITDQISHVDKEVSNNKKTVICTIQLKSGKLIQLFLDQPVKHDRTGIWYVEKYRFIKK